MSVAPSERARYRRHLSSLIVRTYLFNLVFFIGLTAVMLAVIPLPEHFKERHVASATVAAKQLAAVRHDARQFARVSHDLSALYRQFALYDLEGRLIGGSDPAPPLPAELGPFDVPDRLRRGPPGLALVATDPSGAPVGTGVFIETDFGPPPPFFGGWPALGVLLAGVAIASIWFTHRLTRPIEQLVRTAEAFGSGQLSARTGMRRADEFGRLAETFDAMADRICRFLDVQRELMANISHELRTPLARLRVTLDILSEGKRDQAGPMIEDMSVNLVEIDRLLKDIMTLAQLDSHTSGLRDSTTMLQISQVSAQDFIARATRQFALLHPQRGLEVSIDPGMPNIEGDVVLLHRVLTNLLDNAQKYSNADTPIFVRASRGDGGVDGGISITVTDHGVGIEANDVGLLFQPFFRVDRSRSRKSGGFGLGLALAKRIVAAHRGDIVVESSPGIGSSVTFTIPTRRPTSAASSRS